MSAQDPRVLAMAGTLVVAMAFGAVLASGAIGVPGTDAQGGAGPAFTGNVTETPTPSAETLPLTETPTDGPSNDTDPSTDEPVRDPAGGPPTDTETETDTDAPSDPPMDDPVTDPPTETGTDTETDTDTEAGAENQPLDAGMVTAASVPVRVNNSETFFANQAEDPDGEIVSYEWEFGDGGTATGERPSHTYDELGEVEVTVTVTDDDGATDTATQTYNVVEQLSRPTAEFRVVGGAPEVGQEARFVAESSDGDDPGGQIVRYEWDFGDGTTATGQNVTHAFDSEGTYNVTLTVTSSDMLTDTVSKQVTAFTQPPEHGVIMWYEPDIPVAGWDIRFDVDVLSVDRSEVSSYEWDFGDGTTATQKSVQHAFVSEGTYNVTLTVTTTDGQTFTDTRDVEVENSDYLPRAGICRSGEGYESDEEILFTAADSPTGYSATYEWDFGDGTTATGDRVTHSYDTYGTYTVALTATNEKGGEKTIETQVDVQPGMECTGDGT